MNFPYERIYYHALQQLSVAPEETFMVGDNLIWDVLGPQRIGIKGVWLDWTQSGLPENSAVHPDLIINSITELRRSVNRMNVKVDNYLAVGCGRCPLGGTPDCKVHNWPEELKELRRIVLDCGLTEELKWGVPCYTHEKKNILLVSALKGFCALSFFKGVLLKDTHQILEKPGENSQSDRIVKFTNVERIIELEDVLKAYIQEAVEVEKAGLKVNFKKTSEFDVPDEFQERLDEDPVLKSAFEALTPGRQRGYLLHFSGAKQSKTRASRVEKCVPKILAGKGFHDR